MTTTIQVTKSIALTQNQLIRKQAFDRAVVIVLQIFTPEVILRKWNASGLGAVSKLTTIVRWLSTSPTTTKNERFEPFIIGLASMYT